MVKSRCWRRIWWSWPEGTLIPSWAPISPVTVSGNSTHITHALVISCWVFCNSFYIGLPLKTISKLQLVQNIAMWICNTTALWITLASGGKSRCWFYLYSYKWHRARDILSLIISIHPTRSGRMAPGFLY